MEPHVPYVLKYHQRVMQGTLKMAQARPQRWKIVMPSGT
jgi:hypothetical protein